MIFFTALYFLRGSVGFEIAAVGRLIIALSLSMLIGPVPCLVLLDITNPQILVLSSFLVPAYWSLLGSMAGFCWADDRQMNTTNDRERKKLANHLRWKIAAAAFVIALVSSPFNPVLGMNFSSKGPAIKNRVINNLRQLDAAKQQLALETNLTKGQLATMTDLMPYLNRSRITSIAGERYVLDPMGEPPFAILDSDWRIRRKGWREGFTIPKGTEYHLP